MQEMQGLYQSCRPLRAASRFSSSSISGGSSSSVAPTPTEVMQPGYTSQFLPSSTRTAMCVETVFAPRFVCVHTSSQLLAVNTIPGRRTHLQLTTLLARAATSTFLRRVKRGRRNPWHTIATATCGIDLDREEIRAPFATRSWAYVIVRRRRWRRRSPGPLNAVVPSPTLPVPAAASSPTMWTRLSGAVIVNSRGGWGWGGSIGRVHLRIVRWDLSLWALC